MGRYLFLIISVLSCSLSAEVMRMNQQNGEEILSSTRPTIVDVYADWCPPCAQFGPIFSDMSDEREAIQFVKLNADQEPELARKFRIKALPTTLFLKGGKELGRKAGSMSKEDLEAAIHHYFKN